MKRAQIGETNHFAFDLGHDKREHRVCGMAIPKKARVNRLIGVRSKGLSHEMVEDRDDRFPIGINYVADERIHAMILLVERKNGTADLSQMWRIPSKDIFSKTLIQL